MHDEGEADANRRSGWRRLGPPSRGLLLGLSSAGLVLLSGVGAICIGSTQAAPAAEMLGFAGKGLLLGGALLAIGVTLRVWCLMFRAAGFIARHPGGGESGDWERL